MRSPSNTNEYKPPALTPPPKNLKSNSSSDEKHRAAFIAELTEFLEQPPVPSRQAFLALAQKYWQHDKAQDEQSGENNSKYDALSNEQEVIKATINLLLLLSPENFIDENYFKIFKSRSSPEDYSDYSGGNTRSYC